MCRLLIFFILVFSLVLSHAQSDSTQKTKVKSEIFFNVSDALGRASGNSSSGTFITDPILLGAKFLREETNSALRVGANFRFVIGDELGSNFQRVSRNEYYSVSVGLEKRKDIGHKFQYYYGIDLRYLDITSSTNTFFGTNSTSETFSAKRNGPGLAPLFGIKWNFAKRFSLFTEASLSIDFINNYRYVTTGGFKTVLEDKIETSIRPTAPGVIFLTFDL